jgi:hypothetical protein
MTQRAKDEDRIVGCGSAELGPELLPQVRPSGGPRSSLKPPPDFSTLIRVRCSGFPASLVTSTRLSSSRDSSRGTFVVQFRYAVPPASACVTRARFQPAPVSQVYPFEYDLILKPDVNTQGHTQWFYFSVSNMVPGIRYKFNIINLLKPDSLYNHGMQPVMFSVAAAEV